MSKSAVVIGGGVGGLSAAIHLARRGIAVTLLEKNPRVGGKLNLWEVPHPNRPNDRPFRFDTGPSLLTLPLIFHDLFAAAGMDVRDFLPIQRLDPIAQFSWRDGTTFTLRSDPADRDAEIRRIAPQDVRGFRLLLKRGEKIWNLSAEHFLFQAPEQLFRSAGFSPWAGLQLLLTPLRIGMFRKYAKLIDRHIQSPKLRELLYQYATYSGANPFRAPATLAVIPFVEMQLGGWYLPGGMYRLAEQLESAARKLGVTIHANCEVAKILTAPSACRLQPAWKRACGLKAPRRKDQAIGVLTITGTTFKADAIIANSDVIYTYRHLIDPPHRTHFPDAKLNSLDPGSSGFVLMLGVDGTYPQLAHHNKFMPSDYRTDLAAMFDTHTVPTDPAIYLGASTRTDSTQSPDGCENLFILASAPALDGKIDWKIEAPKYRNRLIQTLERDCGLADLSKRIVVERAMTPADLKSLYNANAGSIYGIGSNSRRSAFLRPPNRDRDLARLYFCGGATHPGGGLPLVALSGKIAADLAAADLAMNQ